MPYLRQDVVADRLSMDVKKMLRDRVEFPARDFVVDRWEDVKKDAITFARGAWADAGAHDGPVFADQARRRILAYLDRTLRKFADEARLVMDEAKRQAYDQQYLAALWVLDQTTPPNVAVRPRAERVSRYMKSRKFGRRGRRAREAWFDEPPRDTADAAGEAKPETRLDGWLKAWQASVLGGLVLSGVQGDTATDVGGKIESARAGGLEVEQVLARLIQTEVQISIANADDTIDDEQGKILHDRVWQTMDDERVCPECEARAGKSEEELDEAPPLHPVCRCWWRLVPKAFQDLSDDPVGSPGSRAMVFRDPKTGKPAGQVIVNFDSWVKNLTA